jgi:hypothetical protein
VGPDGHQAPAPQARQQTPLRQHRLPRRPIVQRPQQPQHLPILRPALQTQRPLPNRRQHPPALQNLRVTEENWEGDPDSPSWQQQIDKQDGKRRELTLQLKEAEAEGANSARGTWEEVIAETDAKKPRQALLVTVERVWVLVIPRGNDRLAFAWVRFRNGTGRGYLLFHRSPTCCGAESYKIESFDGDPDVDRAEKVLLGLPQSFLEDCARRV